MARGSGLPVAVVAAMLEERQRLAALMKKMESCNGRDRRAQRELAAFMERTKPHMLAGLGGTEGLQALIAEDQRGGARRGKSTRHGSRR